MVKPTIRSVYVHAPFCARRCFYCDFAVTVDRAPDSGSWLAAIGEEFRMQADDGWEVASHLDTLFVGGGTPSLLGASAMEGLAEVLGRGRLEHPELEWTVEANPESVTPALVEGWRRAGVNRISLGVQSFEGDVLRWMGRLHGAEGAREAVRVVREGGIENVSVDLIFGLPSRLKRCWSRELDEVLALELPHVSLYGLTAEPGTPLGRAVGCGRESLADGESYREEYLEASTRLRDAGYRHYEVSNFARGGAWSRHNEVYWSGRPYLGLGSSAHSYRAPIRRWNIRDWAAYRSAVQAGRLPVEDAEQVEGESARLEGTWLALRTDAGLPLEGMGPAALALVDRWREGGLAEPGGERVRLTPRGWLVLDRLAVDLDALRDG